MVYNDRAYSNVVQNGPSGALDSTIKCWELVPPGPVNGHTVHTPLMILALAKKLWFERCVYHESVFGNVMYRVGGELLLDGMVEA